MEEVLSMTKTVLCLCIIISKLLNVSTDEHIKSEDINEILDTLIKQAENGKQHGSVVIDKVENQTNDSSKIIYLKPKDSEGLALPTNDEYSEEIIVEMKETSSAETEKRPHMNHITKSYPPNQNDEITKNDEFPNSYFTKSEEESTIKEYQKYMRNPPVNNNNQRSVPSSIKDEIETPKKYSNERTKENLIIHNMNGRILTRRLFPTEDIGNVRLANEDNAYSLQNILGSGYLLNMPSVNEPQSFIPGNLLTQTLQDEAAMNLNYLHNFVPAYVTPSNVIRTVIQQSYHPHSGYPGEWLSGPTCCIP
ncbi:hypothetical protein evm_009066 [Chilo suppressalis]|nr:hypothetical protein evm_009066 [Chilo suppressalis]